MRALENAAKLRQGELEQEARRLDAYGRVRLDSQGELVPRWPVKRGVTKEGQRRIAR
jgi:hypothetical protein